MGWVERQSDSVRPLHAPLKLESQTPRGDALKVIGLREREKEVEERDTETVCDTLNPFHISVLHFGKNTQLKK